MLLFFSVRRPHGSTYVSTLAVMRETDQCFLAVFFLPQLVGGGGERSEVGGATDCEVKSPQLPTPIR
jgi:hypothetical protein